MSDLTRLAPERVLLVWLGRLGDFVVSTPFLAAVRARYPASRITLLTGPRGREAAELVPEPDERLTPGFATALKVARGFDLAVDLNPSPSRGAAAWLRLSRAPIRLGFEKSGPLTHRVPQQPGRESIVRAYGRLAEALGAPFSPVTRLAPAPQHRREAAALLSSLGADPATAWLALHAGNFQKNENRWPEPNFVELGRRLSRPGLTLLFVAGPGEAGPVGAIARSVPGSLVLAPPSLGVTAAALAALDLYAGNVTGTLHVAAAAGAPTFALYTGYTDAVWRPVSGPHAGVVSRDWADCRTLAVDDVYRALEPLVSRAVAAPKPKTFA